jgi:hypothetical protein
VVNVLFSWSSDGSENEGFSWLYGGICSIGFKNASIESCLRLLKCETLGACGMLLRCGGGGWKFLTPHHSHFQHFQTQELRSSVSIRDNFLVILKFVILKGSKKV